MTSPSQGPISSPVILCGLCLALGAAVVYRQNTATLEKKRYHTALDQLSNQVQHASAKLEEQKHVNLTLGRNLATVTSDLARQSAAAPPTPPAAEPRREPEPERALLPDPRLVELEGERDCLSGQLETLTGSMSNLQAQLASTQRRLETSDGDRRFLLDELKRLRLAEAKLQQQFNDLATLRDQLRKVRTDRAVSRRLEWARRASSGNLKGGELLQRGLASAAPAASAYRLEVEVDRNGAVKATDR